MYTSLRVTAPPAVEPVAIADMRQHLRVDYTADDALIASLVTAARQSIEGWIGRALITQTLTWTMAQQPPTGALPLLPLPLLILPVILTAPQIMNKPLELPRSPVQSVSAVTMTATDGTVTTLVAGSDYTLDTAVDPARITLSWLSQPAYLQHIQVAFVAGYGASGAAVPAPIIAAIKLLVAHLYENRGDMPGADAPPKAIDYLINPYKVAYFA